MKDWFDNTAKDVRSWIKTGFQTATGANTSTGSAASVLSPGSPVFKAHITFENIISECAEEIVKKARSSAAGMNELLQFHVSRVEIRIPPGLRDEGVTALTAPSTYLTHYFKDALSTKDVDCFVNVDSLLQVKLELVNAPATQTLVRADATDGECELVTFNIPRLPDTLNNRLVIVLSSKVDENLQRRLRSQLKAEKAKNMGATAQIQKRSGLHDLIINVDGIVTVLSEFPAIVGKNPDADLRLSNEAVSGIHLRIDFDDQQRFRVTNMGTNRTYVNYHEMRLDEQAVLGAGGVIALIYPADQGGINLVYRIQAREFHDSGAATPGITPVAPPEMTPPTQWRAFTQPAPPKNRSSQVTKIAQPIQVSKPTPGITSMRSAEPTGPLAAPSCQMVLCITKRLGGAIKSISIAHLPQTVAIGGAELAFIEAIDDHTLMVDICRGGVELIDAHGAPGRPIGKHGAAMHRWNVGARVSLPDGSVATLNRNAP